MGKNKSIQINFDVDEKAFLEILQGHCLKKGVSMEEYVKELIKRDLAWGHFNRKRTKEKK